MKSTPRPPRVFLDTSVLLSGLNSPLGASGKIISLFNLNQLELVVSAEVLLEAGRVMADKFPLLQVPLADFLSHRPLVTRLLTQDELKQAARLLQSEDTPILAGAIKAKAKVLVTLDKRFQKLAANEVNFEILTPGEFLKLYCHVLSDQ